MFADRYYDSLRAPGDAVEMSSSALNLYLNDERKPGADMLARFNAAGMSIDWLLTGNGEMLVVPPESLADQLEIIAAKVREIERIENMPEGLRPSETIHARINPIKLDPDPEEESEHMAARKHRAK